MPGYRIEELEEKLKELGTAWAKHRVDKRLGIAGVEPAQEGPVEAALMEARKEAAACREARETIDERLFDPWLQRRLRQAEQEVDEMALQRIYDDPVGADHRRTLDRFLVAQSFMNQLVSAGAPVRQTQLQSPKAAEAQAERKQYADWYQVLRRDPHAAKPPEVSVASKPVVIGTSARGIIEIVDEEPPEAA